MILRFFSKRNYAFFEKLINAIQKHVEKERYTIITKRFKSSFFIKKKIKCVIMCERKSFTKRKSDIKLKKFNKTKKLKINKCDYKFKVNYIYNRYLNA